MGCSVNALAKNNLTPLHLASMIGNEKNVRLLLDFGACPRKVTTEGKTALHLALTANTVALLINFAGFDQVGISFNC